MTKWQSLASKKLPQFLDEEQVFQVQVGRVTIKSSGTGQKRAPPSAKERKRDIAGGNRRAARGGDTRPTKRS